MKENESISLENELYQEINWSTIIDSLIVEYKDSNILIDQEAIGELSSGYFSKSPWKLFEYDKGEQISVIILKSYCAIYAKKTTNQIKVISFYSDLENKWIRYRMIELVERYRNQLIEFNWDNQRIILKDINNKRKWEFELSENELFLLNNLFESVVAEWLFLIQEETQREEDENKAIDKILKEYSEKAGLDLASNSNKFDEFIHISDLLENPKDVERLMYKYEDNIIKNFKSSFQNIERLVNNLELRKKIIVNIFDNMIEHSKMVDIIVHIGILKNEIYIYQLLYIYSISLISSINKNENESYFKKIYNIFDELNLYNLEINEKHITILAEEKNISVAFMHIFEHTKNLYKCLLKSNFLLDESQFDFVVNLKSELDAVESTTDFLSLLNGIQNYEFFEIHQEVMTQN